MTARIDGLDFVAFDVETANSDRGSICAIGLSVVRDGVRLQEHSWLCRPPREIDWFDGFNISLHNITPDRVAGEPTFAQRLTQMLDVVGDLPIVCHNAGFDTSALRGACEWEGLSWPRLSYGCTMVWSRRVLDLISYRLPIVADALGVSLINHHDAGADATAAAEIALELARKTSCGSLAELSVHTGTRLGFIEPASWSGCKRLYTGAAKSVLPGANPDADPDHPLHGQHIVFTGALAIHRKDAWARVAAVGAEPQNNVTKKTTRLVIGDGFAGNTPDEFTTGKARRAVELRAKGQRIEVLTEYELIALLAETSTAGTRNSSQPFGANIDKAQPA